MEERGQPPLFLMSSGGPVAIWRQGIRQKYTYSAMQIPCNSLKNKQSVNVFLKDDLFLLSSPV